MNQTDRNHLRNEIHHLYRQTSKLNLYIQNTKVLNMARVAAELKQLAIQLDGLSKQSTLSHFDL